MQQSLKKQLPVFFLFLLVLSLYLHEMSKALLSISMIGFVLSVFVASGPGAVLKSFIRNKSFVFLALCFIGLLLSYFNSEDSAYYFGRLQIKLPLLLLPIAFAGVVIDKRKYSTILAFYVLLTFLVAGITFGNYLVNYVSINDSYLKAKVMPTIINHVRFSIMMAMGCYLAYFLYKTGFIFKYSVERWVYLSIVVLLFIFIHIYSVRSGLLALYGIIMIEITIYIVKSKNYWKPALLTGGLAAILIALINLVPTLGNKWINTKEDISVYINNGSPNYNSLTTRAVSYDAALNIFKQHVWFGCGLGNIKKETDLFFHTHYPEIETPILPHNQFLFYLAATGIVGTVFFCVTFFFPLFYKKNRKNEILLIQYVILFLSFQTEPMLETQLGMAYATIFILLPLTQRQEEDVIS